MVSPGRGDTTPESDRFADAPHPRDTYALFGHAEAEATLLAAYRSGRLPQAWIIGGREGIGKATLAWRFARFVFARPDPEAPAVAAAQDLRVAPNHPAARQLAASAIGDLFLLRREWNDKAKKHFTEIRVDEVRRASHLFRHASSAGGFRICIIDAADDLNRNAANALLKLIEEPPPRSLFLIVAHRPGRIIPTIRSRCRMLLLHPLPEPDVQRALEALLPGDAADPAAVRAAAARAGGSVRDALKRLDADAAQLQERIAGLFSQLPEVDWREVHKLAEAVALRDGANDYETLLASTFDWLDAVVAQRAAAGARSLAPYAQVWEKLGAAARETEALNLDKRPLILSLFADLAAATRASRS